MIARIATALFAALFLMAQGQPNPQALYKAGFDARVAGDYPAAIRLLSAAIDTGKLNKDDLATSYNNRGMSFAATKQIDKALADYAKAIELAPTYGPVYLNRGNVYLNQEKFDEAVKEFTAAITISDTYALAYNSRGAAYYKKDELDRALADLNTAIRLQPGYGNAYFNRARVFVRKHDTDHALADFSEAIRLKPNDPSIYVERGDVLSAANDDVAAIKDYSAAIAINDRMALPFNQRGDSYFYTGEYTKAIADYDRAIKLDADYPDPYTSRGRIKLFHLHDAASAADDLTDGVRLDQKDVYAAIWLHIARVRAGQQDRDEFKLNVDRLRDDDWPSPVLDLFLGNATPDQVRSAAKDAKDEDKRGARLCEADFYIGVLHSMKDARAEATAAWKSAVENCPTPILERYAAKAELARLSH